MDKIFLIDFDGTVVDVWERYYNVFVRTAGADISFHDYVGIKRELEQDFLIAEKLGLTLPANYRKKKQNLLESNEMLRFDTLLLEKTELQRLMQRDDVYIFTKRRNKDTFLQQLERLGLGFFKSKAIIIDGIEYVTKEDYIKSNFAGKNVVVIGDSEDDAKCSCLKNVRVLLVKTGLRNPNNVRYHEQCRIIGSLSEVGRILGVF